MGIVEKFKNSKFTKTCINIWKIEDLRTRLLITIAFCAIYRFGSFIVLPGIDAEALQGLRTQTEGGLMSLLDMFSGGAFSKASIFALGIMPYISASIVMQLLGIAVPYFQKMQREGESGRRKMNQYTRYLTVIILLFQAPGYLYNLRSQTMGQAIYPSIDWTVFMITSVIILAAGSMFILWLGERITDKGIGNGISMIIMIGIIARFPQAISQEIATKWSSPGQGGLVVFLIEIVIWLGIIAAAILLVQGVRRVPVQYAKRIVGNRQMGGARQYIPLKPYAANVMPIIFAQAIMFIPVTVAQYAAGGKLSPTVNTLMDTTGWVYNLIFAVLIILFTYLYTAITINPTQMAEDMKRNNGFVPGIKPGKSTADFIDKIMSRITFPGSLFLAFIAIMPAFASMFGVQREFAQFYGGTSLLILVGVVLDTLQQIESHLLMRHYDGLLENGRVHGGH
ncbi:MAG: preprotein translocase subunit SecY [Prevotellaceae bacterium]|nr:preprotein translocase subunit SecY [Candidatus Colivivens equi]MCQ2077065.1 preprotein translocase subunit SecY [Bacteroidaceae bacterium]